MSEAEIRKIIKQIANKEVNSCHGGAVFSGGHKKNINIDYKTFFAEHRQMGHSVQEISMMWKKYKAAHGGNIRDVVHTLREVKHKYKGNQRKEVYRDYFRNDFAYNDLMKGKKDVHSYPKNTFHSEDTRQKAMKNLEKLLKNNYIKNINKRLEKGVPLTAKQEQHRYLLQNY